MHTQSFRTFDEFRFGRLSKHSRRVAAVEAEPAVPMRSSGSWNGKLQNFPTLFHRKSSTNWPNHCPVFKKSEPHRKKLEKFGKSLRSYRGTRFRFRHTDGHRKFPCSAEYRGPPLFSSRLWQNLHQVLARIPLGGSRNVSMVSCTNSTQINRKTTPEKCNSMFTQATVARHEKPCQSSKINLGSTCGAMCRTRFALSLLFNLAVREIRA